MQRLVALGAGLLASTVAAQQFDHLAKQHLPFHQGGSAQLLPGDFDGDGADDVFVIGQVTDLLLRTGANRFRSARNLVPSASGLRHRRAAAGDLDRDGDLDLVIAREQTWNMVWRNDGASGFADISQIAIVPQLFENTLAVALGDVDGDGDLDVVFGGGTDRLYFNDGTASLAEDPQRRLAALSGTTAVVLADFDRDGDLDLFRATNGRGGAPRLDANAGTGVFTEVIGALPAGNPGFAFVIAFDADRDRDLDLLLDGTTLWLNDGTGRFRITTGTVPTTPAAPYDAVAYDRDGDGDSDLALATALGVRLLDNRGGTFIDITAGLPHTDSLAARLTVLDSDSDGDQDLLVAGGALDLWIDVAGRYIEALGVELVIVGGDSILGDIDGDGDLDVVTSPRFTPIQGGRVFINDGNGAFRDEDRLPASALDDVSTTYGMALFDADGDGDQDWALAQAGRPSRLYVNDGTGRFTDPVTNMPQRAEPSSCLDAADIDGDGDLDLAIGASGLSTPVPTRVLLNDGAGNFRDAPAGTFPTLAGWVFGVRFGDIDGDGDQDLLISDRSRMAGQQMHVWTNDGRGRFTLAPGRVPNPPGYDGGITLGDIDGDGDLDLAVGGGLYQNDGHGTFLDLTGTRTPGGIGIDPSFVDFDLDGDLDLLAYQGDLINDGTGRFTAGRAIFATSSARSYAVGDVDGDGDPDVVGSYVLYRNRHRHLAALELPLVGGSATWQVHASPGYGPDFEVALLWLGVRASTPLPIPGIGTLRLDPALLLATLPVLVPPSGTAAVTLAVPNDRGLIGVGIDAQALLLGSGGVVDWRLTNLSSETLIR